MHAISNDIFFRVPRLIPGFPEQLVLFLLFRSTSVLFSVVRNIYSYSWFCCISRIMSGFARYPCSFLVLLGIKAYSWFCRVPSLIPGFHGYPGIFLVLLGIKAYSLFCGVLSLIHGFAGYQGLFLVFRNTPGVAVYLILYLAQWDIQASSWFLLITQSYSQFIRSA